MGDRQKWRSFPNYTEMGNSVIQLSINSKAAEGGRQGVAKRRRSLVAPARRHPSTSHLGIQKVSAQRRLMFLQPSLGFPIPWHEPSQELPELATMGSKS